MGGRREHQVSYDDWKTTPPEPECEWCGQCHMSARAADECATERRETEDELAREREARKQPEDYE